MVGGLMSDISVCDLVVDRSMLKKDGVVSAMKPWSYRGGYHTREAESALVLPF